MSRRLTPDAVAPLQLFRLALVAGLLASAAAAQTAHAQVRGKSAPGAEQVDRLTLVDVTVHFFLERSGTLSDDAAGTPGIPGANMRAMLADGRDEPFRDMLVKVAITSKGEAFAKGPQGRVELYDRKMRRVIETQTISDVYVDSGGRVVRPIWIRDRACQPLDIRVTVGTRKLVKSLELHCGE